MVFAKAKPRCSVRGSPQRMSPSHARKWHHFPQRLYPDSLGDYGRCWPNSSVQRILGRVQEKFKGIVN